MPKTVSISLRVPRVISSIEIGGKVYELNNDYDFNDVLLKVPAPTSAVSIKLNLITKDTEENLVNKTITMNLNIEHYIKLK